MQILSIHKFQLVLATAALALTAACSTSQATDYRGSGGLNAQLAQANVATNIPVLVMGEDEDPNSVKRSSDIFKRVMAAMKGSMQRHGYQMIDEEAVAVDLGMKVRDRRPKTELIETMKLMNQSGVASHQGRAMVLFRIHAAAKALGFSTKVTTRIDGEIYDVQSNRFLDTFEMPTKTYPAPADCLDQGTVCINEVVGGHAREIAAGLGEILSVKLGRYSPKRTASSAGAVSGDGNTSGTRPNWQTMPTDYTVTLRNFPNTEAMTIIGVMSEEFPGYMTHDLMDKNPAVRRYRYQSTAKVLKVEEWLFILLRDMGYHTEKEVTILVQGDSVIVDKLVPTPGRTASPDETSRFK